MAADKNERKGIAFHIATWFVSLRMRLETAFPKQSDSRKALLSGWHKEFLANRGFFLAVLYSAFLLLTERIFSYAAGHNSTIINPFIRGLWFYLAAAGICLLVGRLAGKLLFSCWLILHSIVTIVSCWLCAVFHMELTGDALCVLAGSSIPEINEFTVVFVNWKNILPAVFLIFFCGAIIFLLWKAPLKHSLFTVLIACLMIVPFAINGIRFALKNEKTHAKRVHAWLPPKKKKISPKSAMTRLYFDYFEYNKVLQRLRQMSQTPRLPEKIRRIDPDRNILCVLVLGESATRNHMGIYGYFRDNTPHLKAAKKICWFTMMFFPRQHIQLPRSVIL